MKSDPKSNSTSSLREAIRTAAREVKRLELEFKAAEDLVRQAKLKLKAAKKNHKLMKKAARRLRKKLKKAHAKLDAAMTSARTRSATSNGNSEGSISGKASKTPPPQASRSKGSKIRNVSNHSKPVRSRKSSRARASRSTPSSRPIGDGAPSSTPSHTESGSAMEPATE